MLKYFQLNKTVRDHPVYKQNYGTSYRDDSLFLFTGGFCPFFVRKKRYRKKKMSYSGKIRSGVLYQ